MRCRKRFVKNRNVMFIFEGIANAIILQFTILFRLFRDNNKKLQTILN